MTTETRSVYVDAPRHQVWDVLADFGNIYKFNPNLTGSYSTSDANSGVGATRHCDLTFSGASIEEEIIAWNEGESYQIEIVDGTRTPPFKSVVATLAVADEGVGTRVTMTMEYSLKFGPIGRAMDALGIRKQYAKAVTLILAGLKHYVETGEETTAGKVKVNLEPVAA